MLEQQSPLFYVGAYAQYKIHRVMKWEVQLLTAGVIVYVLPSADIVLSPKRPQKPQLVPFDKNTAALYLRQTEALWLVPNMSRQDGEWEWVWLGVW